VLVASSSQIVLSRSGVYAYVGGMDDYVGMHILAGLFQIKPAVNNAGKSKNNDRGRSS